VKLIFSFFLVGGFDFGERALVTNEPRSATVMTITPTDLLVVDREVFSRYVKI
jgi:CRP-like cAMP-binding protein